MHPIALRNRQEIAAMTLRSTRPLVFLLCLGLLALGAGGALAAESASADAIPEKVTWSGEVASLVHQRCASCHRPGDIGPMSLLTYDETRPWAKSMLRAVRGGEMPPWHADPAHGEFANDRRLSDREIQILERWVKQGSKAGDLAQAPPPPVPEQGWRLGEPDLVLTFDEISLPAGGPDQFHDLAVDSGLEEDRWIRAIEIRPGNRKVVHHVILFSTDGHGPPTSGWLGAWAAGMAPMELPPGTAKLVGKGHKVVADMHYHPDAEAAVDQTRVGLHFYEGEPEKELINLWVQNAGFKIPAGAEDHVVHSTHTFRQDATIHGLLPHMHYRGKEFTYTATFPDGRQQTLLHVPDYDFNWQTVYQLADPLVVPAGTRIDCEAHYDNSTKNAANPDPTKDVTFGNESFDEMMIGFVDYTVNEGQRPKTAEQEITAALARLASEHPGAIWSVEVNAGEGQTMPTALHLPLDGEGSWLIPINGQVLEGRLHDIVFDANAFTATLSAPVGVLQVKGALDGDSASGTVAMGEHEMSFSGRRHSGG
jgi:mono/diheme cytochrome c family protein